MQEILSINIKYTLKDLKEFCFAKTRAGIFNKILFIFSVAMTIFFVLAIFVFILTLSEEIRILVFAPLMIIKNFSFNEVNFIMPLLLGIIFTFLNPIMLYSNSIKRFERDVALQKPYKYIFYDNYYIVEHPSGTNKVQFCDLVKVTEIKTAVLLFLTTQIAHIIPKRAFKGMEDKLKTLVDIAQQKVSSKD